MNQILQIELFWTTSYTKYSMQWCNTEVIRQMKIALIFILLLDYSHLSFVKIIFDLFGKQDKVILKTLGIFFNLNVVYNFI
jgi:hypothetical protein